MISLAKFRNEIDRWVDFLGLGIDSSSNYEINHQNPMPLRSYHPTQGYKDYSSSSDHQLVLFDAGKKRMRGEQKKKGGPRSKRSRVADEFPEPINPPQELVQIIGPNVRPVYLYRKQLSEWDTREDQNRLFVNDRKKLMDFMTEEERLAVEDPEKPGIDILGFDRNTKYEMHSNKWASLDKVVVNKGWFTILDANKAVKGDWVHLWAFRSDSGKFCLYVDFRHQP